MRKLVRKGWVRLEGETFTVTDQGLRALKAKFF